MTKIFERVNVYALLLIGAIVPLAAHLWMSRYARFAADDYCTVSIAIEKGVVGGAVHWYTQWTGLFTNFVIKSAIAPLGPIFTAILPSLLVALWVIVAFWTMLPIVRLLRWQKPTWTVVLLGVLIVSTTIQAMPDVEQSLYWTGGNIPYTLPIIALTFYIGFFTRVVRKGRLTIVSVLIAVCVPFLAGGLSETYSMMQITILALAGVVCFLVLPLPRKRVAVTTLTISLIAALLALAIVVAAPGNSVRQSRFGAPTSLLELIGIVFQAGIAYPALMVGVYAPAALVTAILTTAAIAYLNRGTVYNRWLTRQRVRQLFLLTGFGCLVIFVSSMLPGLYALGEAPPGRVYGIPNFVLICTAAFWGWLMGSTLTTVPRLVTAIALGTVIVAASMTVWQTLSLQPELSAYAAEWDQHDAELHRAAEQGMTRVTLQREYATMEELIGLKPLDSDPENATNRCAADYYGLEAISVKPPPSSALS
jgi:hypothetical protein